MSEDEFCWGSEGSRSSHSFVCVSHHHEEEAEASLEDLMCCGKQLLCTIATLASPTSITGLRKLKQRITSEVENAARHLSCLHLAKATEGDDGVAMQEALSRAQLLLECSGLQTLGLITHLLTTEPDVTHVFTSYSIKGPSRSPGSSPPHIRSVTEGVDVVSCGGARWIKVRAARTRSLQHDSERLLKQVDALLTVAASHYVSFCDCPQVCLLFAQPPPPLVISALPPAVVTAVAEEYSTASPFPSFSHKPDILCLDTTTLVALCSASCYAHVAWPEAARMERLSAFHVLKDQQRREFAGEQAVHHYILPGLAEHSHPVELEELCGLVRAALLRSPHRGDGFQLATVTVERPDLGWLEALVSPSSQTASWAPTVQDGNSMERVLLECFDGSLHNHVIAESAYEEFRWMVETIAGTEECWRALRILQSCVVVGNTFLRDSEPSLSEPGHLGIWHSPVLLRGGSSISLRNRCVFGLADALKAVLLTANKQVCSKYLTVGIYLSTALHPSRALTELKFSGQPRRDGSPFPPPV